MTFGFSLYTMLLLVILITYFRTGFEDLADEKLLEDSKVYHCQY